MSEPLVVVRELTKQFKDIMAVNGVSMTVHRGEALGFLGPNGAGKTTTMRMLTCFIQPTSGTASVSGFDVITQQREVRQKIGYLPEGAPGYSEMTPLSFLSFVADMRGLTGAKRSDRLDAVCEMTHIGSVWRQPFGTLSKGYKRRVALAQALIHDPEILILDEPTDGLDPNQKHEVRALITEMTKDKCIIISTHILEEVSSICTRAIIVDKGKIIADDKPDALAQKHGNGSLDAAFRALTRGGKANSENNPQSK